jgi:predicted alpha/beta superfamily hydrolase
MYLMKGIHHFKKFLLLITWAYFTLYSPLQAQAVDNNFTIRNIYTHNFISAINGQPYKITIALPLGYSPSDTITYPVVYLLDGDPDLPLAALIQRDMRYGNELPDMIMVGIGYQVADFLSSRPFRTLDYTPTHAPKIDSIMTANHHLKMVSGGADKFLRVVQEEVIPFVDRTYRANQDRALAGHSFGGLFVAFVLFHSPELFNRYLISSPSLDWDDRAIFLEEAQFYHSGPNTHTTKIFICGGSLEAAPMIPDIEKLVCLIKKRNYKGWEISEQIFNNETHMSVLPFAISRGLREIWKTTRVVQ